MAPPAQGRCSCHACYWTLNRSNHPSSRAGHELAASSSFRCSSTRASASLGRTVCLHLPGGARPALGREPLDSPSFCDLARATLPTPGSQPGRAQPIECHNAPTHPGLGQAGRPVDVDGLEQGLACGEVPEGAPGRSSKAPGTATDSADVPGRVRTAADLGADGAGAGWKNVLRSAGPTATPLTSAPTTRPASRWKSSLGPRSTLNTGSTGARWPRHQSCRRRGHRVCWRGQNHTFRPPTGRPTLPRTKKAIPTTSTIPPTV
jgi:hypothetical protein